MLSKEIKDTNMPLPLLADTRAQFAWTSSLSLIPHLSCPANPKSSAIFPLLICDLPSELPIQALGRLGSWFFSLPHLMP